MVEDIQTEPYKIEEVNLCINDPREHEKIVGDIGKLNGLDLELYFTGYAIDVTSDSTNWFYGGNIPFDLQEYREEESEKRKEKVSDRMEWLSEFAYTPKEIREEVRKFLEEFEGIKNTLNSPESWNTYSSKWIKIKTKLANDAKNNLDYKKADEYYNNEGSIFKNKAINEGLRVRKESE